MEEIFRRLGKRIREIRIQRGFRSQEEFADYCKIHRTFLGHLETGRKDFRLTTVIRIANALGVTLQELFAGLEAGEPLVAKKAIRTRKSDFDRMLKEVETLERSVQKLKEIACPAPKQRAVKTRAQSKPRRRRNREVDS